MLNGHLPGCIYQLVYFSIRRLWKQERKDATEAGSPGVILLFSSVLLASLELSDTQVYEP